MTFRHAPSTGRTRRGPPLRIGITEVSPAQADKLSTRIRDALRELESRRGENREEVVPLFLAATDLSHCVRRRADGALMLMLGANGSDRGGLALTLIQPDEMLQIGAVITAAGAAIKEIWAERPKLRAGLNPRDAHLFAAAGRNALIRSTISFLRLRLEEIALAQQELARAQATAHPAERSAMAAE